MPLAMYVCIHILLEFWFSTRCHLPNLIQSCIPGDELCPKFADILERGDRLSNHSQGPGWLF